MVISYLSLLFHGFCCSQMSTIITGHLFECQVFVDGMCAGWLPLLLLLSPTVDISLISWYCDYCRSYTWCQSGSAQLLAGPGVIQTPILQMTTRTLGPVIRGWSKSNVKWSNVDGGTPSNVSNRVMWLFSVIAADVKHINTLTS